MGCWHWAEHDRARWTVAVRNGVVGKRRGTKSMVCKAILAECNQYNHESRFDGLEELPRRCYGGYKYMDCGQKRNSDGCRRNERFFALMGWLHGAR